MRELDRNIDMYDAELLSERNQHGWQYNNPAIMLHMIPDGHESKLPQGTLIITEDTGNDTTQYILEEEDIREDLDQNQIVDEWAEAWARNGDGNYHLERCLWGLNEIDDFAVTEGQADETPCYIVQERSFAGQGGGYYPTQIVTDDDGEEMLFDRISDAQTWIDEQYDQTYYLSHGEMRRPSYAIWEQ